MVDTKSLCSLYQPTMFASSMCPKQFKVDRTQKDGFNGNDIPQRKTLTLADFLTTCRPKNKKGKFIPKRNTDHDNKMKQSPQKCQSKLKNESSELEVKVTEIKLQGQEHQKITSILDDLPKNNKINAKEKFDNDQQYKDAYKNSLHPALDRSYEQIKKSKLKTPMNTS
ncbi:unnamed protein product [Mytilus edulis]|uniref:Uncharacterized protein n=1 Tax=Mytilus edulis TaxID=6550 RepID=A0A8S3QSF8_MYTED|nr:unnamed protein product [Mytilus edulis]